MGGKSGRKYRLRAQRRKLRAHDRGENRHNKGTAWIDKKNRLQWERNRQIGD